MALKQKLKLDPTYEPAILYFNQFKEEVLASKNFEPLTVVVERMDGLNESYTTNVFKDENKLYKNLFFVDRLVKTLLWLYGGYKVTIVGHQKIYESIRETYLE